MNICIASPPTPSPTLPRKRERERSSFFLSPLPLAGEVGASFAPAGGVTILRGAAP